MYIDCTFYFCYYLFLGTVMDNISRTCDNKTRLPYPSEVVNIYDSDKLLHFFNSDIVHSFPVKLMNGTTSFFQTFTYTSPNDNERITVYELHNYAQNKYVNTRITHKLCILIKNNDDFNFFDNVFSETSYRFFSLFFIFSLIFVLIFFALFSGLSARQNIRRMNHYYLRQNSPRAN